MKSVHCCLLGALIVFALLDAAAQDAPLTPREQMLLEKVEQLEQRIRELEQRFDGIAPAPPAEAPAADGVAPPVETAVPATEDTAPKTIEARVDALEETVEERTKRKPEDFRVFWKEGLRFETDDKRFRLQVGGRLITDAVFYKQGRDLRAALGKEHDGVEFRLARIDLRGTIYENIAYRFEFDFAGDGDRGGRAKFIDTWIMLQNIPYVGRLKVGHFREPLGMEELTSPNWQTFMEKALPTAFTPKRNLGLMLYNGHLDNRLTWAVGVFKNTDDFPSRDDGDVDQGYNVTLRLTGLPWYEEEGRRMLHLGAAYSHRNPDGAVLGYSARPESNMAAQYVNTERYAGFRFGDVLDKNGRMIRGARMDDVDLFGAETALVVGPISAQAEYIHSIVKTTHAGTRNFGGYYTQASYLITGEHRVYDPVNAVFGRITPKRNFSLRNKMGPGAWEVAVRHSGINLTDGRIRGGREYNYTAGVNWYLNPNTRIALNYTYADIHHDLYNDDLHILGTRFIVEF